MNKPNRLGMYADVQPILDAALLAGGGSYTLFTHGEAVSWRQRAYKFRKLYAETIASVSKYDTLTLPRLQPNSATVEIRLNTVQGQFLPASHVANVAPEFDEDLLSAAEEFAKKLGGINE
jgi:hypothetical protein